MKRITVEEVKAAYEKVGVKPIRCAFYKHRNGDQCACALGAVALASGKSGDWLTDWTANQDKLNLTDLVEGDYSEAYLSGIMSGFDSRLSDQASERYTSALRSIERSEIVTGFEDGRAIAKAVFGDE